MILKNNKKGHGIFDIIGKVLLIAVGVMFVLNSPGGVELNTFVAFLFGILVVVISVLGFVY